MATISSHVLDSVTGRSASGVSVACFKHRGKSDRQPVFDVVANNEGRIAVDVDTSGDEPGDQYELVFASGEYFDTHGPEHKGPRTVNDVVVRLVLPKPEHRYHVPVLIAPHSYTVWWST